MKNKYIITFFLLLSALFFVPNLQAQDSTSHRFTHLKLEMRAAFDVMGEWGYTGHQLSDGQWNRTSYDTTNYGFNGHYFNLIFGGEFGKGFSYFFRQRIIAKRGTVSLFDNTDFLYLQYQINDNWALRAGKDALAIGGYEYDAPPIDVYYYTQYWSNIYCFQLAGSVIFTDKAKKNKLIFQVANSPYVYYTGSGSEWKQGLLGYSIMWCGSFNHFQTLYSVNLFERKRGDFVNYITLGNRLEFGPWSCYVDYQNRAANVKKFFSDFMVVSRMDVAIKNVNLFVKGGYEQNLAEDFLALDVRDPLMIPGAKYWFYGLGVEYRPKGSQAVRLHAYLCDAQTLATTANHQSEYGKNILTGEVGVTCNVDFLRYFKKRLNPEK